MDTPYAQFPDDGNQDGFSGQKNPQKNNMGEVYQNGIPLHPGWNHFFDQQGHVYYVQDGTGTTQWEHPMYPNFRFETVQNNQQNNQQNTTTKKATYIDPNSQSLLNNTSHYDNGAYSNQPVNPNAYQNGQNAYQKSAIPSQSPPQTWTARFGNPHHPNYSVPTNLPASSNIPNPDVPTGVSASPDLPPGWYRLYDDLTRPYFYSINTGEVSWKHPSTGAFPSQMSTSTPIPDAATAYAEFQFQSSQYNIQTQGFIPDPATYHDDISKYTQNFDFEARLRDLPADNLDESKFSSSWGTSDALNGTMNILGRDCIVSFCVWIPILSTLLGIIGVGDRSFFLGMGLGFWGTAAFTIAVMAITIWFVGKNQIEEERLMNFMTNFDSQVVNIDIVNDRIQSYIEAVPQLQITVHCYHYEKKMVSNYYYNPMVGGVAALIVNGERKELEDTLTTTHRQVINIPIVAWVDISPENTIDCIKTSKQPLIEVTYDQAYYLLPEQRDMVNRIKAQLHSLHKNCDGYCEIESEYLLFGEKNNNKSQKDTIVGNKESEKYQCSRICCLNPFGCCVGLLICGCWLPAMFSFKSLFRPLRFHSMKTLILGEPLSGGLNSGLNSSETNTNLNSFDSVSTKVLTKPRYGSYTKLERVNLLQYQIAGWKVITNDDAVKNSDMFGLYLELINKLESELDQLRTRGVTNGINGDNGDDTLIGDLYGEERKAKMGFLSGLVEQWDKTMRSQPKLAVRFGDQIEILRQEAQGFAKQHDTEHF